MHYVFFTTSQNDRCKKFVREYKNYFDVQMVYKNLYKFYATSARVRVSACDMLSYITSATFYSWKGVIESLILNWQDQFLLYELLVDINSYFY